MAPWLSIMKPPLIDVEVGIAQLTDVIETLLCRAA